MAEIADAPATAPAHPTYAEATRVWATIGLLSFGGPAGQIALMHRELVEQRRWISESRFLLALSYCTLIPGPEAQQLAIYVGWLLHGTIGGVTAGILFFLPGFFVILTLSVIYAQFNDVGWITGVFFGLKAAVLAIVIEAVVRIGKRALRNRTGLAVASAALIALFAFAVPFPVVVISAGLFGFFGARYRPDLFISGGGHRGSAPDLPAVIDAAFVQEPPSLHRSINVTLTWGVLWVLPLVLIIPLAGWGSPFATIFVFFSEMAVVTFGGAYAVLAYVAQEAVQHFGWLRPGEMLDGLALAETTPGPLIMTLTFVGFLAAMRNPIGLDPLLAGVLGATLTTWVTFVPCFLWIFLGAPYIEGLRTNKALTAALSAITAAVVGVILNLAVWFGLHVAFARVGTVRAWPLAIPWPEWSSLSIPAVLLGALAMILTFGLRLGMARTLLVMGALGLATHHW
jgi:chromate transporter